jgi:hypothetical protein
VPACTPSWRIAIGRGELRVGGAFDKILIILICRSDLFTLRGIANVIFGMTIPELIIGYEGQGVPVSAACSVCGEWMPADGMESLTSHERVERFTRHFKEHVKQRHTGFESI